MKIQNKIRNKIFAFCLLFMTTQVNGSQSYYPAVQEAMDCAKKAILEAANQAYQQVYDLYSTTIEPTRPAWDIPAAPVQITQPTRFNQVPKAPYAIRPQAQYATRPVAPAPQEYAPPQQAQPRTMAPGTMYRGSDGFMRRVVGAPVAMRGPTAQAPRQPAATQFVASRAQSFTPKSSAQIPESRATYQADVADFNAIANRLREELIVPPKASTQSSTHEADVSDFNAIVNRLRENSVVPPQSPTDKMMPLYKDMPITFEEMGGLSTQGENPNSPSAYDAETAALEGRLDRLRELPRSQTPTEKIKSFYKNTPITTEEMRALLAQSQDKNPANPQSPSEYDAETEALQARVNLLRKPSYGLLDSPYAPSEWSSEETIINPQEDLF